MTMQKMENVTIQLVPLQYEGASSQTTVPFLVGQSRFFTRYVTLNKCSMLAGLHRVYAGIQHNASTLRSKENETRNK